MLSRRLPASVKKRIDNIVSKPDDPLKQIDELLNDHTLLIQQIIDKQSKTLSDERKLDNKKINDAINDIKLNYDIKTHYKQTHIYEKNTQHIRSALNILDIKGNGTIEEILIKSQSSDFTIVIDIDNMQQYQRTWDELNEISEDISGIVAVNRSGTYIMNLSNMHFKHKAKLLISANNITLDKIYMRCSYGKL